MGITEETKQTQHKGSEQISWSSPDQSSAQGTGGQVADVEPQDRVDQVREILFGAQREEYDRRFSRLEELLVKSISDLSNDTTRKFGAIRDEYDKRLTRLEELLVTNISDLNNDTTKKLDALNNNIQERLHEKVDKAAISKLLKEILKISHDLNVAKSEGTSDE